MVKLDAILILAQSRTAGLRTDEELLAIAKNAIRANHDHEQHGMSLAGAQVVHGMNSAHGGDAVFVPCISEVACRIRERGGRVIGGDPNMISDPVRKTAFIKVLKDAEKPITSTT